MKHVLMILLMMTAAAAVAHAEIGDHPTATTTEAMPLSTEPFAEYVSPEDSLPRLRLGIDPGPGRRVPRSAET